MLGVTVIVINQFLLLNSLLDDYRPIMPTIRVIDVNGHESYLFIAIYIEEMHVTSSSPVHHMGVTIAAVATWKMSR